MGCHWDMEDHHGTLCHYLEPRTLAFDCYIGSCSSYAMLLNHLLTVLDWVKLSRWVVVSKSRSTGSLGHISSHWVDWVIWVTGSTSYWVTGSKICDPVQLCSPQQSGNWESWEIFTNLDSRWDFKLPLMFSSTICKHLFLRTKHKDSIKQYFNPHAY